MPLFFVISGFFFRSSLKLNFKEFLFNKSVQLLLPCVAWAIISYVIRFLAMAVTGNEFFFGNWVTELQKIFLPEFWPWFLRELFISYFIVYLFLKLLKKDWLACLLSIVFVFTTPFFGLQRTFLPLFWAGIYLKNNYQFILKYANKILIISGVIFAVCLIFWDGTVTTFPQLFNIRTLSFNFTNVDTSFFRLFIGLFGSLFWFMLFYRIYRNNKFFVVLVKTGVSTLAIYLLQRLLLEYFISTMVDFPDMNIWVYNLIVTPLISLAVLAVCMLMIKFIQKNKYAELLLFGKK